MKDKIRWLLFIAAIAMVGQNMYETGIRLGNVAIGILVIVCLGVNVYNTQKKKREEIERLEAEAAEKQARRRERKANRAGRKKR